MRLQVFVPVACPKSSFILLLNNTEYNFGSRIHEIPFLNFFYEWLCCKQGLSSQGIFTINIYDFIPLIRTIGYCSRNQGIFYIDPEQEMRAEVFRQI
jgi:hypothetical protein